MWRRTSVNTNSSPSIHTAPTNSAKASGQDRRTREIGFPLLFTLDTTCEKLHYETRRDETRRDALVAVSLTTVSLHSRVAASTVAMEQERKGVSRGDGDAFSQSRRAHEWASARASLAFAHAPPLSVVSVARLVEGMVAVRPHAPSSSPRDQLETCAEFARV